jgi:DNA invertase Pin-like site-specific DNA recombinase
VSGRVVGYARRSTDRQGDLGLASQRVAILGRYPEADVREETASGGTVAGRPVLLGVLAELRAGDVLAVAKADRLARNTAELLGLCARAHRDGWTLDLLDLGVRTNTALGEMLITVLGMAATFERRCAVARTVAACDARDPRLAERRVRIRALRDAGWTRGAIARELGCSLTTVRREVARLRAA